ncbi:MAG TPA: polyprenyl synthetase family protein [Acidobacteriota bacterium]|nr:polyprenyl synthetase family protein [Acidobacteriota bacterium]
MRPEKIFALIKDKLTQTEKEISSELVSDIPVVREMGAYITESGGKRIRPALLSLSGLACGYRGNKDIRYGVVFEFVHTATLIHDDIIDEAELRRGRRVMHDIYGTTISILFGDYLYNTAMEMALRDDDLRVIRLICRATNRMIEGEIVQEKRNYIVELSIDDYMDLITRKTADLFSSCALAGAILADAGEEVETAMAGYGLNLGIAFQIIDDYFDYSATRERIGKPVGSDLNEGKITYPLLVLFERAGREAIEIVEGAFARRNVNGGELQRLIEMMREHKALEETIEVARLYAEKARESLEPLPPSEYRDALFELPRYVVERTK